MLMSPDRLHRADSGIAQGWHLESTASATCSCRSCVGRLIPLGEVATDQASELVLKMIAAPKEPTAMAATEATVVRKEVNGIAVAFGAMAMLALGIGLGIGFASLAISTAVGGLTAGLLIRSRRTLLSDEQLRLKQQDTIQRAAWERRLAQWSRMQYCPLCQTVTDSHSGTTVEWYRTAELFAEVPVFAANPTLS